VAAGQNAVAAGQNVVDRTVERGQNVVDRAVERGQDVAARATEMGQRGRDNVGAAAEWTAAAATGVAYRAIDGASAAGRGVADAGRGVADAGRQAVAAGQNVAGKVSRWFKEKQTNTSVRANAARAAFDAFRTDPALQNTVSPKDVKVLSEQAAAIGTAKNWDELNAAIQQFGQSADQRLGGQSGQSAPAPASGQAAGADKAGLPAWALQGNADARGATSQTPAEKAAVQAGGQVAGGQNQGQGQGQGEAPKTTGGKHRAGPVVER
jgi:hypothetical protein